MADMTVFGLADPSRFTGFEQTRVMDLITVLAFASLVIWLIILLGMVIRHLFILGTSINTKRRQHKIVKRRLGAGHGF
jgi:hypothetical protein